MNKEAEAIRRADREEAQEKQREREEQQREREEARRQADEQRWLAMFQATREDATQAMVTAEKQRAQDEERRRLETERAEQRREEIEERRRQERQEDTQIARERERQEKSRERGAQPDPSQGCPRPGNIPINFPGSHDHVRCGQGVLDGQPTPPAGCRIPQIPGGDGTSRTTRF